MIVNAQIGQKILATIGRPGQKPDVNDARLVSPPRTEIFNGRPTTVADIIEETTSLAGEKYLRARVQNLYFAFARETVNHAVDGMSVAELVQKQSAAALSRLLNLPETGQVATAEELGA